MIREVLPVGMLQCNCIILGDEATREAIVIDPGDEIPRIQAVLDQHGLKVQQILLTHAHIDHVAGAARLRRLTGAPIYLNQQDMQLLQMLDMQAGWLGIPTPETVAPDASAEEGLQVGLPHLQGYVLHTPGHTEGSICLHFPEQHLLIAGDTLFAGSIGRTDLPGGDFRKILESLKDKVMQLPDDIAVIPGHGPATTIGTERESNPFLQD
jgi:glyoxylase-like metal-dependent hydrolase (beta-lactamase superfamily II)